ncbi:MAG: HAMP domain-containing sensor histidine kinase [Thermomicrobiales bacterium]
MFASVGRRLALLNAVVVIALIAVVGLAIALVLRYELDQEESRTLHSRAEYAAQAWLTDIDPSSRASRSPSQSEPSDDRDEDDDHGGRVVLEGGDVVLYGVDTDGNVIINDRGFTFSGLPDEASIAVALSGETDERVVHLSDGDVRIVSVPVVNRDGDIVGAVQAARGQTQFQSELRIALYTSLIGIVLGAIIAPLTGLFLARRAMQPIDAAFAAQRAFIADASHELRTPLAVLRANAEMLERVPDLTEEDVRAEARNLVSEVDEIARLVDDLIFLAQADEHAPGLIQLAPVDLSAAVSAEVSAHRHRASLAGQTLNEEIAGGITVNGDLNRLRQALRTLIDNAIHYTPAGGEISVALTQEGHQAVVRVHNTGEGIADDDLRRIFDRFYRSSNARGQRGGGGGLGLAIAKTIVEAHDGTISAESRPNTGATFTIRLPISGSD